MEGISEQSFEALAEAGRRAAGQQPLDEALQTVAEALAEVAETDAIVVRVEDVRGELHARSIVSRSQALAAELAGSVFTTAQLLAGGGARWGPSQPLPPAAPRGPRD